MTGKFSWVQRRRALAVKVSTVKPGALPRGLTQKNLDMFKLLQKVQQGSAVGIREFLIMRFADEVETGPQQLAVQLIFRHKLQSLYVVPKAAQDNLQLDGTDYPEPRACILVQHLQSHPVLKQRLNTTAVEMPADAFYSALEAASSAASRPMSGRGWFC